MMQRMFVTLDTKKTNYKNVGKINHGDDLILELTVLSDGDIISFNDPMADLLVKKSDGKMIRQNSSIEHIKPNKFIIEVSKDCVTSPGLSTNQLIINDNGRISTCMFYYTILNSLEEDIIESISNVEVLEQLDEFTIQMKDKMENFDEELQNRMSELLNGYATESFVANAIAQAKLEGEDVDLSGLATKDDLNSIESGIENLQELINVINEKIAILENSTVITVNSITVTYTGGNVEVGTSISSLTGITVKANYSDGTSKTVTGYTLSTGTISQGSNTITVTYQGKTATFNVTGISNVVTYTLTIDPTPSDSTVKINGVEQKSITVNSGTTVNWTVSKEGYIAQSGSTTVTKTETLSITLQEQTGGDETDTTATLGNAVLAKMVLGSGSED